MACTLVKNRALGQALGSCRLLGSTALLLLVFWCCFVLFYNFINILTLYRLYGKEAKAKRQLLREKNNTLERTAGKNGVAENMID